MAVNVSMSASPSAPAHGQTVVVTYTVTGNDAVDPFATQITGAAVVGGQRFDVSTTVTMPGTPAAAVTYDTPASPDLTFAATADPSQFTAPVA